MTFSLELDMWLARFKLLADFMEEIKDCFGHILAFALLNAYIRTSDSFFR